MPVTIRAERPGDEDAIHEVTTAAFLEAEHSDGTEPFIVRALREADALTLSLVAEDGETVGHIAISPVEISDGSTGWFGAGPLSVAPARQGQGIGSALMNEALRLLRERGAAGCVLLGDPAYYRRFGFESYRDLTYADVPFGPFQALSFGAPVPKGAVTYHPGFDATGP